MSNGRPQHRRYTSSSIDTEHSGTKDSDAEHSGVSELGADDSGAEESGVEDSGVEDSGVEDSGAEHWEVEDSGAEDSGLKDLGADDPGVQETGQSKRPKLPPPDAEKTPMNVQKTFRFTKFVGSSTRPRVEPVSGQSSVSRPYSPQPFKASVDGEIVHSRLYCSICKKILSRRDAYKRHLASECHLARVRGEKRDVEVGRPTKDAVSRRESSIGE